MTVELQPEQLRLTLDPQLLTCATSADVRPRKAVIGQDRAVRALRFGLEIKSLGFNIYVAGLPGTGRTTAATRFLQELARQKPAPPDWCYVNNFHDPYRPKALRLPAGRAVRFQADMRELIADARREIRNAFESDQYAARRQEMARQFQERRNEIFRALNEKAQRESFYIQVTPMGFATIPLREGKPISEEMFMGLSAEEQEHIREKQRELQEDLANAIRQARVQEREATRALQELDREVARFAISHLMAELKESYADCPMVVAHLEEVEADILDNIALFREDQEGEGEKAPAPALPGMAPAREAAFRKYEVNVVVDNAGLEGAPVITELNPTYNNLFGRMEKEAQFGALFTDFTLIRGGSLHRANGGYLLIPVEELLRNLFSWDGLKRALRNEQIAIEEAGERLGFISTKGLLPEPIPLDVKIILIGQPQLYYLLYILDEDFKELFKVKADFDAVMDRTDETVEDYISFVCTVCSTEGLKHLDRTGLARLIEYGSRLAGDQHKLSTRFGDLSDVLREAHFYALGDGAELITGEHIRRAVDEKHYRSSLLADRVRELIARDVILIDTEGTATGQINGLSVVDVGDMAFGRPSRITASVGMGTAGIIDIEREAKLGGAIHTKGVMILAGYLAQQYAQDKPLSLSARLVFEQSYAGVDGDSASSTELYALLSALAGVPIRQGIAVTGSVNQRGYVQPIGGVSEKIEGFFEVCRQKGLTGEQGVIIPAGNRANLMLREDVVEAVREGKFHVWAVETVDEGIEVLTGMPAGARGPDGRFPPDTIHGRVDQRLRELSEQLRDFGKKGDDKDEKDKNERERDERSDAGEGGPPAQE